MIKYLKELKQNRSDFILDQLENHIRNRWKNLNVFEDNISSQISSQLDLMDLVVKLHRNENNEQLRTKMMNASKVNELRFFKYPKRAYQIYSVDGNKETVIIGDLHSDLTSLVEILKEVNFFNKVILNEIQLIFLGDYVDRGKTHFEIMDLLLSIKWMYPKNVVLLRGNHDGGYIDKKDDVDTMYKVFEHEDKNQYFPHFIRNVESNPYVINPILSTYLHFFSSLAYIAFLRMQCDIHMLCHGGVPRPDLEEKDMYNHLDKIKDLTDIQIKDYLGRSITSNLVWSDPKEGELIRWDNGRFSFNQEIFENFKKKFGINKMFRGHVAEVNGIMEHFNGQVITVYSTGGNLKNRTSDETAYPNVTPKIAVLKETSSVYKNF